jgi:NADPH:quinone reductase-like Zn-dependent oxidoreductase
MDERRAVKALLRRESPATLQSEGNPMSPGKNPVTSVVSKAVTYSGRGGYDVIAVSERTVRPPEANEVRIRVAASAVNPTDIALRDPGRGNMPPPLTPGMDAAGTVEAAGAGVTRLKVGDEVMAAVMPVRPEGGAQAAYIVIPAASAVHKPKGVTLIEAATIPMNGLTALYSLEHAALSAGQTLAVSGGAGWLAYQTIVIAKHRGLRVIADAKAAEIDLVRGYGADAVVERGPAFAAAIRRQIPGGADALLDTALLGEKSFGAIKDGGIYIPVRGWNGGPGERGIRIKPVLAIERLERTDWLEFLRELVEAGHLKPHVARGFAPEQVADAQRLLMAGGLRGRAVIVF